MNILKLTKQLWKAHPFMSGTALTNDRNGHASKNFFLLRECNIWKCFVCLRTFHIHFFSKKSVAILDMHCFFQVLKNPTFSCKTFLFDLGYWWQHAKIVLKKSTFWTLTFLRIRIPICELHLFQVYRRECPREACYGYTKGLVIGTAMWNSDFGAPVHIPWICLSQEEMLHRDHVWCAKQCLWHGNKGHKIVCITFIHDIETNHLHKLTMCK